MLPQRLQDLIHPRVFGSGRRVQKEHLSALLYRLPFAITLGFFFTDPEWSPYTVQASLGPSMLPTVQFIGDLWLVETGAWSRRLGLRWNLRQGDVVLWKDPKTGRVSCKRIIGLSGDSVHRFGEYAHLYQDTNYAIVWPTTSTSTNTNTTQTQNKHNVTASMWDPSPKDTQVDRIFQVPDDHVWLEGDCPPFSFDSRHYGPIPTHWICGRLVLRLWPWTDTIYLEDMPSRQSSWLRNIPRPVPFASKEDYLGKRFNFYRISKPNVVTEQSTNHVNVNANVNVNNNGYR